MLDKSFVEIFNPGNIDLLFAGSDELARIGRGSL
jgi:hypothetical protein